MATRFYLVYLVLGQSIFSEILSIISTIINLRTLYWIIVHLIRRQTFLSQLIIFHLISWILLSIAWIVQNSYVIILWNPKRINYDSEILWYMYMACLPLVPVPAVSLLFLTIERCAIFVYHNYSTMKKTHLLFLIMTFCVSFSVWAFILEAFLDDPPEKFLDVYSCLTPNCQSPRNIADKRLNAITVVISILILIALGLLCYFVKELHFKSANDKTATFVTIKVVLVQMLMDIIVHSCAFLIPFLLNETPTNVLGSYVRMISSLNGFICSLIFAKNIGRLQRQIVKSIRVHNPSSHHHRY